MLTRRTGLLKKYLKEGDLNPVSLEKRKEKK